MKFLLLLYADEKRAGPAPTGEPGPSLYQRMFAYREALAKAGAFIDSAPLEPSPHAKTLRPEEGELRIHDGPYAEAREQLGGYFLIEAESMERALEWAAQCPSADAAPIEVRPLLRGF